MNRGADNEPVFRLSDGRPVQLPDELDLSALAEILALLPSSARDIVLRALEGPLPGSGPAPMVDSLVAAQLDSSDPVIAAAIARLYRRRD